MNKILLVFILFGPGLAKAQNIPPHRTSNWSNAGCIDTFSFIRTSLFLEDFFDVNDPLSFQDSAFEHAINFLGNQPVRLIIPEGTFYFKNSIQLKSNVHIQGSGADKTILKFKPSNSPHAIIAHGKSTDSTYQIMQDLNKGSSSLMLENTDGLKEGDWLKLSFNDDEFITSSWALNSVGQFFQISSTSGNSINLSETIRLNIPLTKRPVVELIRPLRNIYISDLKIEQENKNQNNGANIFFNLVVNSKIKSIHSKYSNFSHITLNSSSRISISCSFFELAHEYGGGGKGYGIALQSTSDDNLIENNIFDHLRHSILLQSGANGNVIAYNYSENPYWTEPFFPEDAAGDLVLHGNFPYLNLFEGNICQNIVIDNSHGINGPFNTFFRNRALRYGLFMNDSPASDQQNFIGNVISEEEGSGFIPFFNIKGQDHLLTDNNFRGQIVPFGSEISDKSSLYLTAKPEYFFNHPFPSIRPREEPQFLQIPAYQRYHSTNLNLTQCTGDSVVIEPTSKTLEFELADFKIQPNPCRDFIKLVNLKNKIYQYQILSSEGKWIKMGIIFGPEEIILLDKQTSGIYWVKITEKDTGITQIKKLIIQ